MRYSRNFGYQASIFTCYMLARGDAVVQLDCDLQDPPALIPAFVAEWERGAMVVYGVRRTRQEGAGITWVRRLFYRLIDLLAEDELPLDAGDFRLLDRKVIEVLRGVYDASPYLRGAIASLGFDQVGIPYDREARRHGETHFSVSEMMGLALDGILNHSVVPLRIATLVGLAAAAVALVLILGYSFAKAGLGKPWPAGFTTLTVLILASLSLNALMLGVIGEYLARIYRQVKGRPVAIIEELVNLEPGPPAQGVS